MMRAFWTWDPVSSGTFRAFDEPHAYRNNKWFFDKSVWQKMFRAMSGCGFDAMVLANTHPFPFMVDLERYPDARVIGESTLGEYQSMHHWIIQSALDYDIATYVLFSSIYLPAPLLQARGIEPEDTAIPTDFSLEYTHYCIRQLLESYPELAGVFADASENITEKRDEFLQQAVIDALDAVRPDAALYLRGWRTEPKNFTAKIKRRGGRPIHYSVKYTHEHLVDASPDPTFMKWIETAGAGNVAAEFLISNFEPWTSFSHETVEGILARLDEIGCRGISLHPLSLCDWPKSSDTHFKYQFQRDMVWYSIWGGQKTSDLIRRGQPKWLLRNQKLLPGFEAGSRILELLALYFAGDKQNQWHPQFCSIWDRSGMRLFSVEDMLHIEDDPTFSGREWWEEITGDRVVHLAEYVKSGTARDAYGPDELIEELADLAAQATAAGEQGMRSASGEKELPAFARDAFCMGRLGEFYVERLRAALAHARGDDPEALEHMTRAIGMFKEIRTVDQSHRGVFRITTGCQASLVDWNTTLKALETEHSDASKGEFRRGADYIFHATECNN